MHILKRETGLEDNKKKKMGDLINMVSVQVLKSDNTSIVFASSSNGTFDGINEAIKNILLEYDPGEYKIKLYGDFFDEYVILPEHLNLKFVVDPGKRSVIRAVKALNMYNTFDRNITVNYVIDGSMHPMGGEYQHIKPEKHPVDMYKKINEEHPEMTTLLLTEHFFDIFKSLGRTVSSLLILLEDKTMNLQIALPTRALNEDIHFLNKKIDNLILTQHKFYVLWVARLHGTEKFQKLMEEVIVEPQRRIQEINDHIDRENLLKTTEYDDMNMVIESNNKEYREFIYKILFRIQELLYAYNYFLDRFIDYLEKDGNNSYLLYCLKPLDKQLKDIINGFDSLNRYIHGLGNNNKVIINGVNSSAILLKLAEQNLNSIHSVEFKEAIIVFLNKNNKTSKTKLSPEASNQEVLNALREFTKNCPDADYKLIRFMRDHPQGFRVIASFASALGVIYTIAGLTGMVWDIFKKK